MSDASASDSEDPEDSSYSGYADPAGSVYRVLSRLPFGVSDATTQWRTIRNSEGGFISCIDMETLMNHPESEIFGVSLLSGADLTPLKMYMNVMRMVEAIFVNLPTTSRFVIVFPSIDRKCAISARKSAHCVSDPRYPLYEGKRVRRRIQATGTGAGAGAGAGVGAGSDDEEEKEDGSDEEKEDDDGDSAGEKYEVPQDTKMTRSEAASLVVDPVSRQMFVSGFVEYLRSQSVRDATSVVPTSAWHAGVANKTMAKGLGPWLFDGKPTTASTHAERSVVIIHRGDGKQGIVLSTFDTTGAHSKTEDDKVASVHPQVYISLFMRAPGRVAVFGRHAHEAYFPIACALDKTGETTYLYESEDSAIDAGKMWDAALTHFVSRSGEPGSRSRPRLASNLDRRNVAFLLCGSAEFGPRWGASFLCDMNRLASAYAHCRNSCGDLSEGEAAGNEGFASLYRSAHSADPLSPDTWLQFKRSSEVDFILRAREEIVALYPYMFTALTNALSKKDEYEDAIIFATADSRDVRYWESKMQMYRRSLGVPDGEWERISKAVSSAVDTIDSRNMPGVLRGIISSLGKERGLVDRDVPLPPADVPLPAYFRGWGSSVPRNIPDYDKEFVRGVLRRIARTVHTAEHCLGVFFFSTWMMEVAEGTGRGDASRCTGSGYSSADTERHDREFRDRYDALRNTSEAYREAFGGSGDAGRGGDGGGGGGGGGDAGETYGDVEGAMDQFREASSKPSAGAFAPGPTPEARVLGPSLAQQAGELMHEVDKIRALIRSETMNLSDLHRTLDQTRVSVAEIEALEDRKRAAEGALAQTISTMTDFSKLSEQFEEQARQRKEAAERAEAEVVEIEQRRRTVADTLAMLSIQAREQTGLIERAREEFATLERRRDATLLELRDAEAALARARARRDDSSREAEEAAAEARQRKAELVAMTEAAEARRREADEAQGLLEELAREIERTQVEARDAAATRDALAGEVRALEAKMRDARGGLSVLEGRLAAARKDLEESNANLALLREEIETARGERERAEGERAEAQTRAGEARAALEGLRSSISELRSRERDLGESLKISEGRLRAAEEESRLVAAAAEAAKRDLERAKAEIRDEEARGKERSAARVDAALLGKLRRQVRAEEELIAKLERERVEAARRVEGARDELHALRDELALASKEARRRRSELDALEASTVAAEAHLADLSRRERDATAAAEGVERRLVAAELQMSARREELAAADRSLGSRRVEIEAEEARLRGVQGRQAKAEKDATAADAALARTREGIKNARARLDKARNEASAEEARLARLRAQSAAAEEGLRSAEDRRAAAELALQTIEKQSERARSDVASLEEEARKGSELLRRVGEDRDRLEIEVADLRRQEASLAAKTAELRELERALERARNAASSASATEEERRRSAEEAREKLAQVARELAEAESGIRSKAAEAAAVNARLESARRELALAEERSAEADELRSEVERLRGKRDVLLEQLSTLRAEVEGMNGAAGGAGAGAAAVVGAGGIGAGLLGMLRGSVTSWLDVLDKG